MPSLTHILYRVTGSNQSRVFNFNRKEKNIQICCKPVRRLKDSSGWQLIFTSPRIEMMIDRLAINAKVGPGQGSSSGSSGSGGNEQFGKMVCIAAGQSVYMWGVSDEGNRTDIGELNETTKIEDVC